MTKILTDKDFEEMEKMFKEVDELIEWFEENVK